MNQRRGYRLYVNLGPSQTRRRLKGFGHGVRKVESAGRNQSVIIHTATGQHLRELIQLFADVPHSEQSETLHSPLENLRNLGPQSARWLRDVGIHTEQDLRQVGPVFAYLLVKRAEPKTSLNLLWALAAALEDRDWRELDPRQRESLLDQVQGAM
jgi:hypothetical protein